MDEKSRICSFCGVENSQEEPLIAGSDGYICEECVFLAHQIVSSWNHKRQIVNTLTKTPTPKEIKAHLDEYVIGQDKAKETLSVAVYNHYKRLVAERELTELHPNEERLEVDKSNILLIGPSGTGKTLLVSTLAKMVGVPFVIADATTLTQAGYVGDDVDSILYRLIDVANRNISLAEWGIVYIDEIDKLAFNSESATSIRDISGEGVQQALLKFVEGSIIRLTDKSNRKEKDSDGTQIDTKNILFIVGGAFSGLEKILDKRLNQNSAGIGFHAEVSTQNTQEEKPISFDNVTNEDLKHYGLIPEFVGRFPVIACLDTLDEQTLINILTLPKNSLIKQYCQLFNYDNIELEFSDAAILAISRQALTSGTGARGLKGSLEKLLQKTMFELPSREDVCKCYVDEDAVNGIGEIKYFSQDKVSNEPAPHF